MLQYMYNTPISHEAYDRNFETNHDLTSTYSISFSHTLEDCCVGIVDMVNSTKISTMLGNYQTSRYYEIFLNSMAKIIFTFGGVVIKNMGDCLLYYFPESSKQSTESRLIHCMELGLAMIENHEIVCNALKKENLPNVDYRVSIDYGNVILMRLNSSSSIDIIGSPINICSKINRYAQPNEIVIGGDLHERIRCFDNYRFQEVSGFSLGFKVAYLAYTIKRSD